MKTNRMNRIIVMVALLGGMLAGCQPIEEIDTQEIVPGNAGKDGYTLTIEAVKSTGTKAMALNGTELNTYWKSGEKVGLYVNGVYKCQLTATPNNTDPKKATLRGTLASLDGITAGQTMTLLYPDREDITKGTKWDYTGQTGEAPNAEGTGDLSAKYDYATAMLAIDAVDNVNKKVTKTGVATFQNEQSMFRFIFNDGQGAMTVKSITVSTANESLVRSLQVKGTQAPAPTYGSITLDPSSIPGKSLYAPADGYYYFSLRNETNKNTDTFKFSLVGSDDKLYSGTKAITSKLSYGKFYSEAITVTATAFLPINTAIDDPNAVL